MMYCISIRQPWLWLITHAGKNVENRPRRTHIRGPILLHASLVMSHYEYEEALRFYDELRENGLAQGPDLPAYNELPRGGIAGLTTLIDCKTASTSPWFQGNYGLMLRDSKPIPFRPYRGQLGFFEVHL